MTWLRRIFYLCLVAIGIGLSFYILERLLLDLGVTQLLGIRPHGFLLAGLCFGGLGCLATWYLAIDVAVQSVQIHPCEEAAWLQLVASLAPRCGLKQPPALCTYASAGRNAFAVGRWRGGMRLVLSAGLIKAGPNAAAELIIVHQLGRIARGDVVTQLLLQGFVTAFTLFPTRIFATLLGTSLRTAEDETPTDRTETLLVSLLEVLITPYASLLVRFYGRGAERRGDELAAAVLGPAAAVAALNALDSAGPEQPYREIFIQPLKFSAPTAKRSANLVLYHTPLKERAAWIASRGVKSLAGQSAV